MAAPHRAPPPRDGWADALEEAAEFRSLTPEQRFARLSAACRLAFALLEKNPRREEFLAAKDPLPPDSIALLERLRSRST